MDLLINFSDGLDYFGLIKLINQEPDLWKEVFVPESGKPTHLQSDDFMSLVKPPTYLSKEQTKVYAWFTEFIKDYGNLTGKFT